ncbi:MAG: PA domain-containing protein [Deferrisomatales bacterium]
MRKWYRNLVERMWIACVVAAVSATGAVYGQEPAEPPTLPAQTASPEDGDEDRAIGRRGPTWFHVKEFPGGRGRGYPGRLRDRSQSVSLVGSLLLEPFNQGAHGDVAAFEDLAFIGKWRGLCPGTGVDIIDISRPSSPAKLSDTLDHPDTSMEDMEAIRIGSRDVLAVGLQDCGNDPAPGAGKSGLELYDISNPSDPKLLSFFDVDTFGADVTGVHELDLTEAPGGRVLALLAVPDLEMRTSEEGGANGTGDLLIFDVTDPANPTLVGEWGVLGDPSLGLEFYRSVRQGADSRTLLHSVRANEDGSLAYLSYWDAGVIVLDISDPSLPVFLGRHSFQPGDEGNSHSVDTARGGDLLVQADEDFSPFEFLVTSSAFEGTRRMTEAAFTVSRIVDLPGKEKSGEVAHVGVGCPAGSDAPGSPEDPYLADPTGKIALLENGGCRFDNKIARAQLEGAVGAIVYNHEAGGEALVTMGGSSSVTLPDGSVVEVTIPAFFVQRSTGLLLIGGSPPVTVTALALFDGWGFLRIVDVSDPANAVRLGMFATENTTNEAVATQGTWSVHNPEVRGDTIYAAWYSDGVRVIDISEPSVPLEIGSWTGEGAPETAPPVDIWGVVPHRGLIMASDRGFGLYILMLER